MRHLDTYRETSVTIESAPKDAFAKPSICSRSARPPHVTTVTAFSHTTCSPHHRRSQHCEKTEEVKIRHRHRVQLHYTSKMKYLAAYLLLVNAGNTTPSAADITSVLEAVSIEVEADKVEKLLAEVAGKSAEELIAEGNEKLSSVPTGAASTGGAASAGAAEEAAEEVVEEAAEESDDDMGFGLFD